MEDRPKSGQLTYYKDIEVTITTRPEAAMLNNHNMKTRPKELNAFALGVENPDYIATAGFSSCNAFTNDVLYDAAGYSWPPSEPMPRSVELVLDITDASNNHWTESFFIAVYQSSQVSGHVWTLTGSNPDPSATIYIQGSMPDTIQANSASYCMFGGTNGTYTITAAADNYHNSGPISITLPPTVGNVDFYLGNPRMVVNLSFWQENAFTGGLSRLLVASHVLSITSHDYQKVWPVKI